MNNSNKEVSTADNQLQDQIRISCEETYRSYDGWNGFPGCGDGQDDFADFNNQEGQDY